MKNFNDYTKMQEVKDLVEEIRNLNYILEDEGYIIKMYAPSEIHELMTTSIEISIRHRQNRLSSIKKSEIMEFFEEYLDRIQELVENLLINGVNPPLVNITFGNIHNGPDYQILTIKDDGWKEKNLFHRDGRPLRFKVIIKDMTPFGRELTF
jgi:hypothetical protein